MAILDGTLMPHPATTTQREGRSDAHGDASPTQTHAAGRSKKRPAALVEENPALLLPPNFGGHHRRGDGLNLILNPLTYHLERPRLARR